MHAATPARTSPARRRGSAFQQSGASPDCWNAARYEKFKDERSRPFFDLLALVEPRPTMRVVDLGCGTGELTREMHRRLAADETLGIDSSPAMLEKAAAFAAPVVEGTPAPGPRSPDDASRRTAFAGDGVTFARGDIADFTDAAGFDLVFSNAALQWLPDHEHLFARVAALVRPGGQLAVQMPANHDHPSHVVAAEVAREDEFRAALGGHERKSPVMAPEAYATLLHRLGFRAQHVRLQVYAHELASRDDVVEWVRGTLLTDYQKRLAPAAFERFLARYRERLLPRLLDEKPYFYPFKRVLLWGRRF
jgi:trans-aconitate 2-methyltransferase